MEHIIIEASFYLASIVSIGALFFYIKLAFTSRRLRLYSDNEQYDFNLGVPSHGSGVLKSDTNETVFSYALVAAGTSLSTVFVFFLTASSFFGWLIFLSPIMFAIGNGIMFKVYEKAKANEYFVEVDGANRSNNGLVPFLGEMLTGSKSVGLILILLSFINLLAVLVLELFIGSEIFTMLATHTLGISSSASHYFSWIDFIIFIISVALLLSYVFIGGFRAVLASDVWQIKAMKTAILVTVLSILYKIVFIKQANLSFGAVKATGATLIGFVLNVILANIFAPLSQESSWQRFRAFQPKQMNLKTAMGSSIINSVLLWSGLIFISFGLAILSNRLPFNSISEVLLALQSIDRAWFPIFVFPLITAGCLFAMYSTADTCVSAILYLLDYFRMKNNPLPSKTDLGSTHKIGMVIISVFCICIYFFIHKFFNPTVLQLVFSVFSNLVVIAPTVLLTNKFKPCSNPIEQKRRTNYVLASLLLGSVCYWSSSIFSIVKGEDYLWLSQLAILLGLIGASLPTFPLFFKKS